MKQYYIDIRAEKLLRKQQALPKYFTVELPEAEENFTSL